MGIKGHLYEGEHERERDRERNREPDHEPDRAPDHERGELLLLKTKKR